MPEQVNCRTAQLNYLDVLQFFPSFVETRMTGFILFIPASPLADLPGGVGRLAPCQYPQVPQAQQPQHEHGEVAARRRVGRLKRRPGDLDLISVIYRV